MKGIKKNLKNPKRYSSKVQIQFDAHSLSLHSASKYGKLKTNRNKSAPFLSPGTPPRRSLISERDKFSTGTGGKPLERPHKPQELTKGVRSEHLQFPKGSVVSLSYATLELGPLSLTNTVQFVPQTDFNLGELDGTSNHFYFDVLDETFHRIYLVDEKSVLGGGSRPFSIDIYDAAEDIAFTVVRKKSCKLCWFGARTYGSVVTVELSSGKLLGRVKQLWTFNKIVYSIENAEGVEIGRIEGPTGCVWCTHKMNPEQKFPVRLTDPGIFSDLNESLMLEVKSQNSATNMQVDKASKLSHSHPLPPSNATGKKENDDEPEWTETRGTLARIKLEPAAPSTYSKAELQKLKKTSHVSFADQADETTDFSSVQIISEIKNKNNNQIQRQNGPSAGNDTNETYVNVNANGSGAGAPVTESTITLMGSVRKNKLWDWRPWRSRKSLAQESESVSGTYAFHIEFPKRMTPESKAVVIGAGLLINLSFYEQRRKQYCNYYGSGCYICILVLIFILFEIFVVIIYFFVLH